MLKMTEETKHSVVASSKHTNGYIVPKHKIEPIARVILMAVYDDNHIFSKLRGLRYIVKSIWEFTLQFNKHHWKKYIKFETGLAHITNVTFPSPQNLNINMMPFIMNDDFDKTKLPKYCKGYHSFIQIINENDVTLNNKICYLSIHESFVEQNKTQRRPGLHVETPGKCGNALTEDEILKEDEIKHRNGFGHCLIHKEGIISWGRGWYDEAEVGGIYMASNLDNSCIAWDCKIDGDAVGHLGDIEHLRQTLKDEGFSFVNKYQQLMPFSANVLYWITDRTPHESLNLATRDKGQYRQFFRLVTYKIDVWYERHSTSNPNGVLPDPNLTKIIKRSKFEK